MYKRVAGTKDILAEECIYWQKTEQISRNIFSLYNYREIRTPIIEEAGLFNRSLGESTELVQKQMFLINNKEDSYALRPEGTAAIVRAYLEANLDKTDGFTKLFYIGPMFRLERPQKGRLRQFHHIGCEVIGSDGPEIDIEVIALADNLLKAYGINGYSIKLNSLGCSKDKKELSKILELGLKNKVKLLCDDCKVRFEHNILRILDCKNQACQEVVNSLKITDQHLCSDCKPHFEMVVKGLDLLGINYEISPYLVRGLDYYTRTVFEIKHSALGAQDAIGAGGRYDNLVSELGGPKLGAIGFAFGVERLLLAISDQAVVNKQKLVYLVSLGQEAKNKALRILANLRNEGIACDTDFEGKSLKGAMRKANDLAASFVLIIGDDEIKNNVVTVKDMVSGVQKQVKLDELIKELKNFISEQKC